MKTILADPGKIESVAFNNLHEEQLRRERPHIVKQSFVYV